MSSYKNPRSLNWEAESRQEEIAQKIFGKYNDITVTVWQELKRATANYGPMHSEHEAYAIIKEEIEELWDEIKKKPSQRSKDKMREEAVQTMAMLARFIIDCDL